MIFITGTDTNIGKTLVSSWLCLHTQYDYFKPIQTGVVEGRDSDVVSQLSGVTIHPEAYCFQAPVSPHWAAQLEGHRIDIEHIHLPQVSTLIVEGAGGVLVPVNEHTVMLDLILKWHLPVILVSSTRLGTINHTLLSLEALRHRGCSVLGVIMTGEHHASNHDAIERYGQVSVLGALPQLSSVSRQALIEVPLGPVLTKLFETSTVQ